MKRRYNKVRKYEEGGGTSINPTSMITRGISTLGNLYNTVFNLDDELDKKDDSIENDIQSLATTQFSGGNDTLAKMSTMLPAWKDIDAEDLGGETDLTKTGISSFISGYTSGLSSGIGPLWSLIPAAADATVNLISGNVRNNKINRRVGQLNTLGKQAESQVRDNFNYAVANTDTKNDRFRIQNMLNTNYAAFGGLLETNGSNWDTGATYIDNGSTHQNNPLGGVQYGVAADGVPNLVEEGEVVIKVRSNPNQGHSFAEGGSPAYEDYVLSAREYPLLEEIINANITNNPNKYEGMSWAEIYKAILDKNNTEEVINRKDTKDYLASLNERVAQAQETTKLREQQEMIMDRFKNATPEEQNLILQQAGYPNPLEQTIAADGGRIYIKPSKRGTFTAAASKHGMGVQEFASKVLANKEDYSPAMVKKAVFAHNSKSWSHANGGYLFAAGGNPDDPPRRSSAWLYGEEPLNYVMPDNNVDSLLPNGDGRGITDYYDSNPTTPLTIYGTNPFYSNYDGEYRDVYATMPYREAGDTWRPTMPWDYGNFIPGRFDSDYDENFIIESLHDSLTPLIPETGNPPSRMGIKLIGNRRYVYIPQRGKESFMTDVPEEQEIPNDGITPSEMFKNQDDLTAYYRQRYTDYLRSKNKNITDEQIAKKALSNAEANEFLGYLRNTKNARDIALSNLWESTLDLSNNGIKETEGYLSRAQKERADNAKSYDGKIGIEHAPFYDTPATRHNAIRIDRMPELSPIYSNITQEPQIEGSDTTGGEGNTSDTGIPNNDWVLPAISGANLLADIMGITNIADYSNANRIGRAILPPRYIGYDPNGRYVRPLLTDKNYISTRLGNQNIAAINAAKDLAGGNSAAALNNIALNNYINNMAIGQSMAQTDEANNEAIRQAVAANNAVDRANAEGVFNADRANQSAWENYVNRYATQKTKEAMLREEIDTQVAANRSANWNNFLENMQGYFDNQRNRDMANAQYGVYGYNWKRRNGKWHIDYDPSLTKEERKKAEKEAKKEADKLGRTIN